MKLLFWLLCVVGLMAQEMQESSKEPVIIEDMSGLSEEQLRQKANKDDRTKAPRAKISISDVAQDVDDGGHVDLAKLQQPWEDLSPTPKQYDWIQTKSGEWFKGEIKAMYDEELEFDSDEVGLYTFNFQDIKQIKSYHIVDVNIEGVASISGILRYRNGKIEIIQGDHTYEFDKDQIVSLAKSSQKEQHNWSGKVTISVEIREGNKEQFDYNVKANIKRNTATTRLLFDYIGRISNVNGVETANDHRLNEKYDVYITRYFFWTPIFSEYYQDKFQNIDNQYSLGIGLGYTIIDKKKIEWDISGGPAMIHTEYISVVDGEEDELTSFALEMSTRFEYEISKVSDITFKYNLTFTDKKSGLYKHHMIATLENELLSWLDFDITGIWDHIEKPEIEANGVEPLKDDYQLLFGIGIEF